MSTYSTFQVAKMLRISKSALSRHILAGKVAAPPETMAGGIRLRLWTEGDIEQLREALPKIANGRKTRYKKKQSEHNNRQSAKTKTPSRVPVPHKKHKPKKK